jgi:uncharacterized protein (DUF305 family)
MRRLSPRRAIWRAALLTGFFSGTFSTLIITLGAPRIGRSPALDWMEIGTVLLGADSIVPDPAWTNIASGLVVHQSADLFWALVFFGLGARWTARRSPAALLIIGVPWAVSTSVVEYYGILPWLQPLVPMQVPYWTALGVHLTSSFAYPAFPWIHGQVLQTKREYFATGRGAALVLAAAAGIALVIEILVQAGWEPRLPLFGGSALRRAQGNPSLSRDGEFDRRFMQHMTVHHEIGVRLAELSVANAARVDLQELSRLMIANQKAEIEILEDWWRRWFGGTVPPVSAKEHHQIPGMPSPATMNQLATLTGTEFEKRFLPVMIEHHQGAVMMADMAWRAAEDPRLRIFAESLRHAQRGQIQRLTTLATSLTNTKAIRD